MRAGTLAPSLAGGTVLMASSDTKTASPMAVRSPSWRLSSAWRAASRSLVGSTRTAALPLKLTMPTFMSFGTWSRNSLAASFAAASRVGEHVGGLHRQRGVDGEDDGGPVGGHLGAALRHGEREHQHAEPEHEGSRRGVALPAGAAGCHRLQQREVGELHRVLRLAQLDGHVAGDEHGHDEEDPEAAGRGVGDREDGGGCGAHGVFTARGLGARVWRCRRIPTNRIRSRSQSRSVRSTRWSAPDLRMAAAMASRCVVAAACVPLAQLAVAGVDLGRGTGLGVGEHEGADIGERQLAGVDDLDGQDVVAHGEPAQPVGPGVLVEEVGDDDDHAAAPGDGPDVLEARRRGRWCRSRRARRWRAGAGTP